VLVVREITSNKLRCQYSIIVYFLPSFSQILKRNWFIDSSVQRKLLSFDEYLMKEIVFWCED
jgi:hypothetical protein